MPGRRKLAAITPRKAPRQARSRATVDAILGAAARTRSLEATIRSLVAAIVQANLVDPCLHRVLEGELPELDRAIADKVRALLSEHRAEIAPRNLALATYVVMRVVDALVHAALIDPPRIGGRIGQPDRLGDQVAREARRPKRRPASRRRSRAFPRSFSFAIGKA